MFDLLRNHYCKNLPNKTNLNASHIGLSFVESVNFGRKFNIS